MTLGENLQRLRKEKGLSQEDVARHLFVSRQSVSKWELDQAEPGVEYLKALAGLYGVTLDELTGMAPPEPSNLAPLEPVPFPSGPDPEEEERLIRWYRTLFAIRTAFVVLENLVVLLSITYLKITLPFDWIAMLVGLFIRHSAVCWIIRILLCVNLAINVILLLANPVAQLLGLVLHVVLLWVFTRPWVKNYFHMPQD